MNTYYIYQWVDHDSGQPFYIGKGHGDRMYSLRNRSKRFLDYLAEHPNCSPEIIRDGLTEDEAFAEEARRIAECKRAGCSLVNIAYGGRGGIHLFGKDNPMYGRPWYTEDTPAAQIDEWKRKIGRSGAENPMWGISPSERMDTATYQQWREAHRQITGEKNPNYGNHTLSQYYSEHPEAAKEKQGRPGAANGRCRPVRVTRPDGSTVDFPFMRVCAQTISNEVGVNNMQYLSVKISACARSGSPYKGYRFEFI